MKRSLYVSIMGLFLLLSSAWAIAHPPGPPPERGWEMDEGRREELRRRIETIWIWRLCEELDLTQEEEAKVVPVLRRYEDKKYNLMEENRRLVRRLDEMIKAKAPEAEIKRILHSLVENRGKILQLEEEAFRQLEGLLSVEKQARYILFQEHFRREIHRLIREARHKGR